MRAEESASVGVERGLHVNLEPVEAGRKCSSEEAPTVLLVVGRARVDVAPLTAEGHAPEEVGSTMLTGVQPAPP